MATDWVNDRDGLMCTPIYKPDPRIVAVDFDGTLVGHDYPRIGREVPQAFHVLRRLREDGHRLILLTMRHGEKLLDAVHYCHERGVGFWAVNNNPEQNEWTGSRKVYAHVYIDDAALGCPLREFGESKRPVVDWGQVTTLLYARGLLSPQIEMPEEKV